MSYKTQFDDRFDIDPKILTLNLPDISWHNDMGPSWEITDAITLMVFEKEPEDRENPDIKRYSIFADNGYVIIYIGNDTDRVLQLIELLREWR